MDDDEWNAEDDAEDRPAGILMDDDMVMAMTVFFRDTIVGWQVGADGFMCSRDKKTRRTKCEVEQSSKSKAEKTRGPGSWRGRKTLWREGG